MTPIATAIAQARHVYEGDKGAEGALDYLEAVLDTGHLSAANQPKTRMDAGSEAACSPLVAQDLLVLLAGQRKKTEAAPTNIANLTISVDTTGIAQALALVEQLKLSAEGAAAALASLGVAPAPADRTLLLVLEELHGLRAELVAGRRANAAVMA